MKKIINRLIITIIVSSMLFYTIEINFTLYFSIILGTWILIFLNYKISKNLDFFDALIIVYLGNFISFIFVKEKFYSGLEKESIETKTIIMYLMFLLVISIASFLFYTNDKKIQIKKSKLMAKRKKDLDGLLYYVSMFDMIGLNGRWGTGKSFLINELKEKIKDEYEIIEIDILSCNLNELQLILIKEIEDVMYKNRIISKYSNRLKSFLANESIISKLQGLIFNENMSFSETIKGFQHELNKLDKKIIIIYEDIDRISDENIIKKIFSISEKLSSPRIKIIYQYHEDNLKSIGFTDDYLEKYIPFKMNLTEVSFFEILNFKFNENNYDKALLEIKDFDFLREYSQRYRYNVLSNEFHMDKEISLIIRNVSMRKVENFLTELIKILTKNEYKEYKEIVISFFFVKHFIPTVYEKLSIEQGLLETLKFNIDSKSYTIMELIAMYDSEKLSKVDIEDIFKDEENKIKYGVLKLFNYKNNRIVDEDNYEKRLQLILEEPINNLKDRNSNEKKDRLIWSLLAHGKSQYTDYEYVGNKFIREVLGKTRNEQINAYRKFNESLFQQDSQELDNGTIFKIGIPSFIELFKSFRILDATDDQQIGLVDIYFEVKDIKDFEYELIQTMNYCGLNTKKEYIYILGRLSKLNVIGNLNSEKCFSDFLKKYISALSEFGYIDTSEYFSINSGENIVETKNYIINDLKRIIEDINKLKDKLVSNLQFKELEYEFNTIIVFIDKLIEIINCESKVIKKEHGIFTSSFSSRFINQEEFDRLKKVANEDADFKEEVRKSYMDGKITVYEIDKLIDELNK